MGADLVGRLLVATPRIGDPNFERTVVLLLAHTEDEGTFGVVINRPSETPLADLVPAWADRAAAPPMMFLGGPVAPSAVVGVGVVSGPSSALGSSTDSAGSTDRERPSLEGGWRSLHGPVGTVDLNQRPDALPVAVRGVRLFAGSAGWSSGQLDSELAEQAWWVVDLEPGDLLTDEPGQLWRAVLRRQSGSTAWFATYPVDPLVN